MTEELISFETAKLAKEKGFDGECYDCFNTRGMLFSNGWCENIADMTVPIPFNYDDLKYNKLDFILRPSQSLLQRWLRESKGIHVNPVPYHETADHSDEITGYYCGLMFNTAGNLLYDGSDNFATYEEALEFGLLEALKIL